MYEHIGTPPAPSEYEPVSSSIESLFSAVERSMVADQSTAELYDYLGAASGDAVIATLVQLIKDDTERYHALLNRVETSLGNGMDWTPSATGVPSLETPSAPVRQALIDTATALMKHERTTAHCLRDIAHRNMLAGVHRTLVELMAMDRDKHAHVLQCVRERLVRLAYDGEYSRG